MCVTRRSDLSQAEFRDYWLNQHGNLVEKYAHAYNIKRYVQSHTILEEINMKIRTDKGMSLMYDGVAELWWNSKNDFIDAVHSIEGKRISTILYEDEKNFIDFSKSTVFLTEENLILNHNH